MWQLYIVQLVDKVKLAAELQRWKDGSKKISPNLHVVEKNSPISKPVHVCMFYRLVEFVNQHHQDAWLTTVDEIREIWLVEGRRTFPSHATRGLLWTRQCWFQQHGPPTIFFTHSTVDNQWPELSRLMSPDNQYSNSCRNSALFDNPRLVFSLLHQSTNSMWVSLVPHITGWGVSGSIMAVPMFMVSPGFLVLKTWFYQTTMNETIHYIDKLVSTDNPAKQILMMCAIVDFDQIWRTSLLHDGKQECDCGFPKPLQQDSIIVKSPLCIPYESTATTQCNCQHGGLMWTWSQL